MSLSDCDYHFTPTHIHTISQYKYPHSTVAPLLSLFPRGKQFLNDITIEMHMHDGTEVSHFISSVPSIKGVSEDIKSAMKKT